MSTDIKHALEFYKQHLMIPHLIIDNKEFKSKIMPEANFHYEWPNFEVKNVEEKKTVYSRAEIPPNTLIPYIGVGYFRSMFPRTFLRAFAL